MLPNDVTTLLGTFIYLNRDPLPKGQHCRLLMKNSWTSSVRGTIEIETDNADYTFKPQQLEDGTWETVQMEERVYN